MSVGGKLKCGFAGGCGHAFTSHSELLEHIVHHIDEGESGRQGLHNGESYVSVMTDGTGFTQAKVLNVDGVKLEASPSSWDCQASEAGPSITDVFQLEPPSLFSELDGMGMGESLEDELVGMERTVSMDEILQPANPCLELVSASPLPVLDHVNWKELLQNQPSDADFLEYEDTMDPSIAESYFDEEDNTVFTYDHDPLSLSPSAILPHDDLCRSVGDEGDVSNGPMDSRRGGFKPGKNLEMMWCQVQPKLVEVPKHPPGLKYIRSQQVLPGMRSHASSNKSHHSFRQELVTFVTKEKRSFKAIVTTPRSKPKLTNRRQAQQQGEDVKYYSAEFILKEGLKKRRGNSHPLNKPYLCPVPGCGKAYKNPNGIKYHARYGHSAPQEFPCHCGKIYSTRHGLMAHRRSHSSLSNSPEAVEEFYSYSEPEESDEYPGNEPI